MLPLITMTSMVSVGVSLRRHHSNLWPYASLSSCSGIRVEYLNAKILISRVIRIPSMYLGFLLIVNHRDIIIPYLVWSDSILYIRSTCCHWVFHFRVNKTDAVAFIMIISTSVLLCLWTMSIKSSYVYHCNLIIFFNLWF